jgi:hypothetical protein
MHAMKSGTPGSGRSGFPSEKFREDPLRLGVNLAKRMTVRETDAFALLRKHLFALVHGEIAETVRVTALLAGCWHKFGGAESQRMHAGKLGRMEDVRWEPPVLSFRIERHGAMGMGSTRAELQDWRVDLDRKTAQCESNRGYRQALPRAEVVRIEPIARELADSIIAGSSDQRLKWQGGDTVRVLMAKVFPYNSGYIQTVTGRRKRLRAALEPMLAGSGWRGIRGDVYSKASSGETHG